MRHRRVKDELGAFDVDRGTVGGRRLVADAPARRTFQVVAEMLSACRAAGFAHTGTLDLEAVRAAAERLDRTLAGGPARTTGPLMNVLMDNPFEVPPPKRSYLVCRAIIGQPAPNEELKTVRLDGGNFLVLQRVGPIDDLEAEYGFIFGEWLGKNGYGARPQIREVYPNGLEVDDPANVNMVLKVPIALRMPPSAVAR